MKVPIPVDVEKSWGRQQPGEARALRRSANWEIFRYVDPDRLRESEKVPPEVQRAFEEVFGTERLKDLKLCVHPLLRRWTLFERIKDPQSGQTNAWAVVSVFHTGAVEGFLPPDLDSKWTKHLRSFLGNQRMPTRRDFELIEKFDVKKYGEDSVQAMLNAQDDLVQAEIDYDFNARIEDFLDYHFWLAMQEAQDHYSKPWSVATVELKSDKTRWVMLEKAGALGGIVKMRVRFGSPEHINSIADELVNLHEQLEADKQNRGLSRKISQLQRERRLAELAEDMRLNPSKYATGEQQRSAVKQASEAFVAQ